MAVLIIFPINLYGAKAQKAFMCCSIKIGKEQRRSVLNSV